MSAVGRFRGYRQRAWPLFYSASTFSSDPESYEGNRRQGLLILREQADLIKELFEALKLKATARPTKAAEIVCGKALRR